MRWAPEARSTSQTAARSYSAPIPFSVMLLFEDPDIELGAIGARHHALGPVMIDRSAGKIRELGAGVRDFGLPVLIGIADDGVRVRHVKIMANQRDAEGRIEVIQQDRS